MIWWLLALPMVAGALAFVIGPNVVRRALLVATGLTHAGLLLRAWCAPRDWSREIGGGWLGLDEPALLFLSVTSALFLAAAVYAVGYLAQRQHPSAGSDDEPERDWPMPNFPEAVFTGCMLLFLATMTLVAVSRHFGLMWVAVEATTLASAPLIYFHRDSRSLEATWKYLMICSVGIALALLGNFFLAVAAGAEGQQAIPLTFTALLAHAKDLDPTWLRAAFVLLLVGYGTKMGLAPLHTWLPDAHSEAPSMISALLSGALLNCAFLTILRAHHLLVAAGAGDFSRDLLVLFGLFSMALAAVFIIGQADYKRMLAYSSVEHMGILALGIGVGGAWAGYGSLLHTLNHSLAKGMLFLVAGNILAVCQTKSTTAACGLLRRLPVTAVLWMAGFLAITGSPPFGSFVSELSILKGIIDAGRPGVAAGYLAALAAVFVGMATIVIRMVYGPVPAARAALGGEISLSPAADAHPATAPREPLWSIVPPAVLGVAAMTLGLYIPPVVADMVFHAAQALGAI